MGPASGVEHHTEVLMTLYSNGVMRSARFYFGFLCSVVLLLDVSYSKANDTDSTKEKSVVASAAPTRTIEFQNGVQGYNGTIDTEIWALAPTTLLDKNINASTDANNDGGESQVVMRFDDIVGQSEHQIPPGSRVVNAKLIVNAFDQGDTVGLHRMLVPFGRAPTWNSLIAGVSADDVEASRHRDSFTFGKIAASTSLISFDVTDTVQDWVNGHPNHGWVFINAGGNGWDFYVSDFDNVKQRPLLVVVVQDTVVRGQQVGRSAQNSPSSPSNK
jgi:hypothetical protein